LAFYFPDVPLVKETPLTRPLNTDKLDQLLDYLYSNGIKAIVDFHLKADGWFGSPEWMTHWVNLVSRFKNDKRILAWELMNEVTKVTWHESITGSDVLRVLTETVDKIRDTGDRHPIVYPNPTYWGYLGRAEEFPEEYRREKTILSFHAWNRERTLEEALEKAYQKREEWQSWLKQNFSVWMSETGVRPPNNSYGTPWDVETEFFRFIINACVEDEIGFNLWGYGTGPIENDILDDLLASSNYVV